MAGKFVVHFRLEDGIWQDFAATSNEVLIGRGAECDLTLEHREVSRQHARLRLHSGGFELIDLNSSNGTLIEGVPLLPQVPYPVQPGQQMRVGGFTLILEAAEAEKPKETTKSSAGGYVLRLRRAAGDWQELTLEDGEYLLGRAGDANVVLDDEEVSRHHARLLVSGDSSRLVDNGSTNGTRLGNIRLEARKPYLLKPGQGFSIGPFSLEIVAPASTRLAAAPLMATMVQAEAALEAAVRVDAGSETVFEADKSFVAMPVRAMNLISHERVTIGRALDNNVVLNHPLVSRYHAVIERMGTRFRILDLRSSNGVFVNEKRIEREAFLKNFDQIRIGPYLFVLAGQNLQQQAEKGLTMEARHINQRVSSSVNLLQDISLTIQPNEFVALVGMSGSGKTTFLNALSGYWPASHGEVVVDGVNLYEHYDLFRNDIGYVPQKDIVHAELTPEKALDYVAQLRMPSDTSPDERRQVLAAVLEDLDLTERRHVPIARLSGGQLKRVSIGCELLTKPRLFFLDEPTSGLDPGTEYDMMKLLRRLADQGRTVILITHATKNVMLCDKVIFLARGGNLAFYGAPEDALAYFDSYRTERERREKAMEFDDIYRILNDESRGAPPLWRERYLNSPMYYNVMGGEAAARGFVQPPAAPAAPEAGRLQRTPQRISAFRQFMILSARNLKILTQDKVSLALMLALAPMIGLMDFIWGKNLYDPVEGDAAKIITMWFMMALITVLVGALSSVREIVKEVDIYKRERAVNLKIMPYVLSKVWVGVVLALYQAGVLLALKILFVRPEVQSNLAYLGLYLTLFIGTLCGYLVGLAISASAPNQNAAMMLIIVVLVPQFLFAGALLPLDLIPGGQYISLAMPTRWAFESFIRLTDIGEQLVTDPCWTGFEKADRLKLPAALKEDCPCMGANIFTSCANFPGILSPDFYDAQAQSALAQPEPLEPPQPTAYPYPTAIPSPTALPTPTLLPSPTPLSTPQNPADMTAYMDARAGQGQEYQDSILGQFDEYRLDSQEQGQAYSEIRTAQGDEYADLRQAQGDEYAAAMRAYGDTRAGWQESREKAISSAEAMLGSIYDNYQQAFDGSVVGRWVNMAIIMAALSLFVLVFQKRKDVV